MGNILTPENALKFINGCKQDGYDRTEAEDYLATEIREKDVVRVVVADFTELFNQVYGKPLPDPFPKFPECLKHLKAYVTWSGDKNDKQPFISGTKRGDVVWDGKIRGASFNEPNDLVDYETAINNIRQGKGYSYLGVVPMNGYVAPDLDSCRNSETGEVLPWAKGLFDLLPPTYANITPSGAGLRPWLYVPSLVGRKVRIYKFGSELAATEGKDPQVEILTGRYATIEGDIYNNAPSVVAEMSAEEWKRVEEYLEKLETEHPRGNPTEKPARKSDFQPDGGFKKLFDEVGWEPLIARLNKMEDTRFHNLDLSKGEMHFCPMPGHGERGTHVRYAQKKFAVMPMNENLVHCIVCEFSGDLFKTIREFDAGEEGGRLQYLNYYGVARQICSEHGLKFEEFFPTKAPAADGRSWKETQPAFWTAEQRADAQSEYDATVKECDQEPEHAENPYPVDAWKGTPYYDFAMECRRNGGRKPNYIPLEYSINSIMTVTGAICGNRITPVFNPTLEARFITLLLSTIGGIGKNEVMEWAKSAFEGYPFLYSVGQPTYKRIGCLDGTYGGVRGFLEAAFDRPRLLQVYGELTTLLEKVGIQGSGRSFLDQILNLADRQTPDWQGIKGSKVYKNTLAPKEISNTVLAGTTVERMEESMSKTSWETLIQRVNLVPTDETKTVFKLVKPDLTVVRSKLAARVSLLEVYRLVWSLSPEAEALGEDWYEKVQERITGSEGDSETFGRIQTYLFRIIGHLALWHAPLPKKDVGAGKFVDGGVYLPEGEIKDQEWEYEVPADLMARAIRIAEWQMIARSENMPTRGVVMSAIAENLIKKWASRHKSIRWNDLKERSHINRYGYQICDSALKFLERAGVVVVRKDPKNFCSERDWIIVWVPQAGRQGQKRWSERRGRPRKDGDAKVAPR